MLYDILLGLEIIIDIDILKCNSQYPNSKHALAILMNLLKQSISLIISLRYLQDNLSDLGVESLLYLSIAKRNSFLEKGD